MLLSRRLHVQKIRKCLVIALALAMLFTYAIALADVETSFDAIDFDTLRIGFARTKSKDVKVYEAADEDSGFVISLTQAGQPVAYRAEESETSSEWIKIIAVEDRHVVFGFAARSEFEEIDPLGFVWMAGDIGAAHLLFSECNIVYKPKYSADDDAEYSWTVAVDTKQSDDVSVWTWRLFNTVYISKSGTKYHYNPTCSNMKNADEVSLEYALGTGRTACSRCVK